MTEDGGNSVGLKTRADERRAVESRGGSSLLGAKELLLSVGVLGALVGVPKDRSKDGEVGDMGENGAERDGRGLDGREVVESVTIGEAQVRRIQRMQRAFGERTYDMVKVFVLVKVGVFFVNLCVRGGVCG